MHYLMILSPVVSLLAAEFLSRLMRDPQRQRRWMGFLWTAAALSLPFVMHGWYYGGDGSDVKSRKIYGDNPFSESGRGRRFYSHHHESRGSDLYVFGSEPQILYYAHRRSASRYIFIYPATLSTPSAEYRQHEIFSELNAHPPRVIVAVFPWFSFLSDARTPSFLFEQIASWVPAHYRMAGLIPLSEVVPNALLTDGASLKQWGDQIPLYPPPKGFLLTVWQHK